MITKLPPWVWSVAWLLAFIAGMVNVIGFLGFEHQAMTHLTGMTSNLATAIANINGPAICRLAAVIGSFVLGCMVSGIVIGDRVLKLGYHYAFVLLLEAILLCVAVPLLNHEQLLGICLATGACGLQNAMTSTYSGAVVRTTHVSGMFTDLGIFLGHAVRGFPSDIRRLKLCFIVISGFLGGGIAGTLLFRNLGYATLYFSGVITCLMAIAYVIFRVSGRNEATLS